MLEENLEKQFTFMTKITSYTCGHAFIWNKAKKKFEINPSPFFQVSRWILTVWSVWSAVHEMYWMCYGMRHADQMKIDDLTDILYAGGGLVCASLHVAFHFVENRIVRFVNQMVNLNSKFEGYYYVHSCICIGKYVIGQLEK